MDASTPLEVMDGALLAVRRGGARRLLWAFGGSAPLALCALAIYYLERVEGVRSLRFAFALLLVLGFFLRSVSLSRLAREYALAIRPSLPVLERASRAVDVCCTAGVAGFGLWVWLWPLAALTAFSPFAAAGVLPFMSLRGAVAPSWLARASCARERGLAAFGQAFDDTAGMRGAFAIVELLALFGMLGLFGNLFAVLSFALLLGHSMLGIDVAFVASFLSPDNGWTLLVIAALTLLLLEPLRAAISAQAFVAARSLRDGADLHAAIDAVIESGKPRPRRGLSSVPPFAAALLLTGLALPAPARAQVEPGPDAAELDTRTRADVERILARPEFREFAAAESKRIGELIEELLDRLFDPDGEPESPSADAPLQLPAASPFLLMAVVLLALLLLAAYASAGRRAPRRAAPKAGADPIAIGPHDPPSLLLDDAAALAARGDLRGALRALYIATLLALDRERLIEFEPWKTNGMYLRALPEGEPRASFVAFTSIFDRTFYGHEPATAADYEACRALAERITRARTA